MRQRTCVGTWLGQTEPINIKRFCSNGFVVESFPHGSRGLRCTQGRITPIDEGAIWREMVGVKRGYTEGQIIID